MAELQRQSLVDRSIIIHKLSKNFETTSAVKEFSVTLTEGKVYALLGHNGCGKSTLINVLSGVLRPTHGNAFIFGMNVNEDMTSILKSISVCAQHDVLWDHLTVEDHVILYSRFRSIDTDSLKQFAQEKLREVGLDGMHSKKQVCDLSGGMKRRLSLVLSTIGENKVKAILLDEPTTGLDPVNKRRAWKLIERLKKNRVVILTSHSMEEADLLGDQIMMMHSGKLRAFGTSLFLKARYGSGYQLTIVQHQTVDKVQRVTDLESMVKIYLPSSAILSKTENTITVSFSRENLPNIQGLLRHITKEEQEYKNLISETTGVQNVDSFREWAISNSTLEQVVIF